MNVQKTCPECNTRYCIEWHDFRYSIYDVEDDEYEETEPAICPFCGVRDEEYDEDEL